MGRPERAVPRHPEEAWEALVRRMASQEHEALAELYDQTHHLVYSLALRIVGDAASAEDVVIEVYTHAWRAAPTFEAQRGSPSAWLLMLARSRSIDILRARGRDRGAESLEAAAEICSEAPGPEDENVAAERRRFIVRALQTLVAEQREAIELAYFGGLSHSEIATRLQQPLGTVKTRIRLGMIRLRELLADLEPTTNMIRKGRIA